MPGWRSRSKWSRRDGGRVPHVAQPSDVLEGDARLPVVPDVDLAALHREPLSGLMKKVGGGRDDGLFELLGRSLGAGADHVGHPAAEGAVVERRGGGVGLARGHEVGADAEHFGDDDLHHGDHAAAWIVKARAELERAVLVHLQRHVAGLGELAEHAVLVGAAGHAHKNGMFGKFAEASNMTLKMNEDGTFELGASLHDPGCGVVTVMKVIIAEVLGVSHDLVAAGEADTSTTPFDYGTFGSRVTYVVGACAKATAEKLKEAIITAAADLLHEPL